MRTGLFAGSAILGALVAGPASSQPSAAPSVDVAAATRQLLPLPEHLDLVPGRLPLGADFAVATRFSDQRLTRALRRATMRLERRMGAPLSRTVRRDTAGAALVVVVQRSGPAVPTLGENESYTLDLSSRQAVLRAPQVVGALRGLETFLQLIQRDSTGFFLPLGRISDRPRFPWRGLLIDVSRHFEPVTVIERNLDAMAMVKLNVLHWHLSDDQGFRVESRRYPKLQRLGSDSEYYTRAQIRDVVAYARDRGIRVVPEFDMPGHTTSWLVAYPRLASTPGPWAIAREFDVFNAAFDPTREEVYAFIEGFVSDMAPLFPDAYWHIGGDEVNGTLWTENRSIRRAMRRLHVSDAPSLHAVFNRRLSRILRAHGKHMVGWDEILHPDLPKSTVVQSWRGPESLIAGVRQGYAGILSAGYYLDAMSPSLAHYAVDPLPADAGLDSAQAARVLGGEVCMWGELVWSETIDARLWPRTAAVAERLWSPRAVTDGNELYRRLTTVNVLLEEAGTEQVSGPDRMLRRMAASDLTGPLDILFDVAEPVSLKQRQHLRRANQLTPLVAPGDIARPDPNGARDIQATVTTFLQDSAGAVGARDSLSRTFGRWRAAAAEIHALAAQAPLARDADSAAAILATMATSGDEAIDFLRRRTPPPSDWLARQLALLDQAAQPRGLLHLTIVPPMRDLIMAAGNTGPRAGPTP
ncbi:MAG TPA: beta-N-acetylhexosaminidase [Gemmatimonadaceae bacterium]|nr:beta-N-acetylhexosaminidase [Gemmatimonadaceae bacterium]